METNYNYNQIPTYYSNGVNVNVNQDDQDIMDLSKYVGNIVIDPTEKKIKNALKLSPQDSARELVKIYLEEYQKNRKISEMAYDSIFAFCTEFPELLSEIINGLLLCNDFSVVQDFANFESNQEFKDFIYTYIFYSFSKEDRFNTKDLKQILEEITSEGQGDYNHLSNLFNNDNFEIAENLYKSIKNPFMKKWADKVTSSNQYI